MKAAGISVSEVRVDNPTLENTFVATLRSIGHEMHDAPFPARHSHKDLKGQIAIGAERLTIGQGAPGPSNVTWPSASPR